MEVTALCIGLMVTILLLLTDQGQNSHNVQRADAAILHISPNRLQFFEYESISLNCVGIHSSSEWRVMTKTSSNVTQRETSPGFLNITPAYATCSGEYWCENGEGERSNTVNIAVTAGDVILESPALPVMEGQRVTLRCRKKATTSNSPADFYKDGCVSDTGYTGEMTFQNVSMSSEGLYKCKISGAGESPESWLAVRAYIAPTHTTSQEDQETPPHRPHSGSIQLSILLPAVLTILCVAVLLTAVGLLQCRKRRVSCFSSEMPTTESDPVYENANAADPQTVTYASVTKHKKNSTGHREANTVNRMKDVTYAVVTPKRNERVSGEANAAEANRATYAAVRKQRH
ncbi:low affinity immunoglobulin gamma Fc region receptor II-b-like isoform X2 [Epinephelus fuscoguttatus]|uniref:low affinity immunoglobulin gamma Fc region receptor II-b-like isoform X2 n=1 Tax=Epinephelus fuscoguttatus TaxID=293821 RepID=UPI0020D062BC|nr:low affinity immunoglobulin gamma Fc region receptor II-b-like isoform X2 [Epinephelus fuscoguttatus]